nr:transposon Ty3-I Gag-Pol polyprotein [Tanacetum cinerariifolium]
RERLGKEKIRSWPKMKAKMKQKFLPSYYIQATSDSIPLSGDEEEVIRPDEEIPPSLPPTRSIQHKIDFIPGYVLPNKPAYRTNQQQTIEIKKQVDKLLEKGLIRESLSPCAVPTLLVPKKNGKWRMCMDNRSINKITINYLLIPRLNDLLDELHGATMFSKIALRSGYHQIRIYEGDEAYKLMKRKSKPSMNGQSHNQFSKSKHFTWNPHAQLAFEELKKQLSSTPVLALPCFDEVFEIECDASGVGIGAVLSQLGHPIAYFSEKLNDAKRRYTTTSSHPQTDGQTKVINRTFCSLLRALITTNMKQWEELLPRAEFAYNRAPSKTTGISPFMAVYEINPPSLLDLTVLHTSIKFSQEACDFAANIKAIHQRIHDKITKNNELLKYKREKGRKHVLFQPGDLVWLHLRKERKYGVSSTFNVVDLQPYFDPDELIPSLRPNFFEDGEDDRKAPTHISSPSNPSLNQKWVTLAQLNT